MEFGIIGLSPNEQENVVSCLNRQPDHGSGKGIQVEDGGHPGLSVHHHGGYVQVGQKGEGAT